MRTFTLVTLALAACARTGTGAGVRTDITARIQSVQAPITQCYADALQRNRKLRGMMVAQLDAAADSGQFEHITLSRDEPGDPGLRQCVIDQLASLKLAKPQRTAVQFSYPFDFQPTK